MTFSKLAWLKNLPAAHKSLSKSQIAVLLSVFNMSDADGTNAYASARRVAADTGMSQRQAQRCLADLANLGYIVKATRGGRSGDGRVWASSYNLGTLPEMSIRQKSAEETQTSIRQNEMSIRQKEVSIRQSYVVPPDPFTPDPSKPDPELDMSSTGVEGVDSPSGQNNVDQIDSSLSMRPKALNVDGASPQAPLRNFPDHELRPLPQGWHINGAHVSLADKYGINCRELAEIWRRWIEGTPTDSGPRQSTNWDRFYAHVVLAIGDDDFDPDGRHFMLEEFGDVDNWWDRGSQSAIWLENTKRYPDVPEDDFSASEFDTEALIARPDLPAGKVYGNEWVVSKACRFACRDRGLDFDQEIEAFLIENSDGADTPMGFEKRFIRGLDRISA